MSLRVLSAALLALSLGACATVERYDAAGDIHAFLVSIRDNDKAGFDAHVDRPALKAQLRVRVQAGLLKRNDNLAALASMFAGPLVDAAVDQLVQPGVFLAVAEANGYAPSKPLPGRAAIAGALRNLDDGRVCVTVKRDGPCVLDFRNEDGTWRLVAFEGEPGLQKLRF